jgi:hypothetical protein
MGRTALETDFVNVDLDSPVTSFQEALCVRVAGSDRHVAAVSRRDGDSFHHIPLLNGVGNKGIGIQRFKNN